MLAVVDAAGAAERTVRVGVYQNRPGVFYEETGPAKGFYIDVLNHTADVEGWDIEFVKETWPVLIESLRQGTIDLLVGIAHTKEREALYDFTDETVFANWGQVYVKDAGIESLLDLRGKRLAGLAKDIYTDRFRVLLKRFDIKPNFIAVEAYEDVLKALDKGDADAGIISRATGLQLEQKYDVRRSPIVCCAMEIRYAVPKGRNGDLLIGLNKSMRALKADSQSLYFQSLDTWFGSPQAWQLPNWVIAALVVLSCGAILFFGGVLLLRQQVYQRTQELQEAHDLLEQRVTERTEELQYANDKLLHLARHDPLTGLPNRRWFSEHLEEDIKNMRRQKSNLAVLFLDLDGFKSVNDTLGHDIGDKVLAMAGQRIRGCLREVDKLARLGGDEFIVTAHDIKDLADAEIVAEKILNTFSGSFEVDGHTCRLGVSIGISLYSEHGDSPEALLGHADIAMYEAKRKGRNTYRVYAPGMVN